MVDLWGNSVYGGVLFLQYAAKKHHIVWVARIKDLYSQA